MFPNVKDVDKTIQQQKKEQEESEERQRQWDEERRKSEVERERLERINTYEQRVVDAVAERIATARSAGRPCTAFSIDMMQQAQDAFVEDVWKKILRELRPSKGYLCILKGKIVDDEVVANTPLYSHDAIRIFFNDGRGWDLSSYTTVSPSFTLLIFTYILFAVVCMGACLWCIDQDEIAASVTYGIVYILVSGAYGYLAYDFFVDVQVRFPKLKRQAAELHVLQFAAGGATKKKSTKRAPPKKTT